MAQVIENKGFSKMGGMPFAHPENINNFKDLRLPPISTPKGGRQMRVTHRCLGQINMQRTR